MGYLSGKTALIVGASAGIGEACARLFAREGANLVLGARGKDRLEVLARDLRSTGVEVATLAGDASDPDFGLALADLATTRFGHLHIALNNAGILGERPAFLDMTLDEWRRVLANNLDSAFYGARAQIPHLLKEKGGSLIFTSSFVGLRNGMPNMSAYGTAKAALGGLVKCLASEFGAQGLRINGLVPGGIDTDMAREFADTPDMIEFVKGLHAMKRLGTPDEVAQGALYLASDLSSFTTGSMLFCDGGVSISKV
ncbi:SDR family oxidoreductase [Woodsholea maritima]|uniref:SDR family oxidoreductase n=1 Tax=Woodsholea maritima TaxID=240237 RepID=UPI0003677758|nr:SDR family oxidoreductase [Woodsholea maritima]